MTSILPKDSVSGHTGAIQRALMGRKGFLVSINRVGRLMGLAGMKGLRRGKCVVTTRKTTTLSASDLVNRVFHTDRPDQIWVTDVTYVRTSHGWVYTALVTDAFNREIVAAHVSHRINEDLVRDTLSLAVAYRGRQNHPIVSPLILHSDHGSVYTAIRYGEQMINHGITPSFGSVGDALDNALAEAVNSLYKAECVNQDGPFGSTGDVLDATIDWVDWYNNQRLHEYLDYHTPTEIRRQYYSQQQLLENQPATQQTSGNKI